MLLQSMQTIARGILKYIYYLPANYIYDASRYVKYSASINVDKEQLTGDLNRTQHVVEKGLSLKNVRSGFGMNVLKKIKKMLDLWVSKGYHREEIPYQQAVHVVQEYLDFHEGQQLNVDNVRTLFKDHLLHQGQQKIGGTIKILRGNIQNGAKGNFDELTCTRHSIRNFSEEPVHIDLVKDAIRIAQRTPSVCNRQTSRVYIVSEKREVKSALNCQNGNRGFTEFIDKVLIVTSELKEFRGWGERNQCFVDGGMFSMTLIHALHFHGIGVCPLNWSAPYKQDRQLRKTINIKPSENVIMMLAIGNLPDKLKVAQSNRKSLNEIATFI